MNLRVFKCRRASGTIVAAVMAIAIMMLFLGGTILWQGRAQSHMNNSDKNRLDERLSVQAIFSYDNVTETYSAAVKVKNVGTIDIQLIRMWIVDDDNNDHKYIDVIYSVPAGSFTYIDEIDDLTNKLDAPFDVVTTNYFFKAVTSRGNTASSLLVPKAAAESGFPAIVMPGSSWIKAKGSTGYIHLEVWNNLEEEITIMLIVTTREESGSSHTEVIELTPYWTLAPQAVTSGDFIGQNGQVYKSGEIVFLELINVYGIVVSSYYFVCG